MCSYTAYHGRDGYLSVSDGKATPLNQHYSAAVRELGLQHVDCNGESQIGKRMIYQYLVYSIQNATFTLRINIFKIKMQNYQIDV